MNSAPSHPKFLPQSYLAVLLLFFVPTLSVELLSGNTTFTQYLSSPAFFLLNILYGVAVILARETLVKWNKGFSSMFLLGIAYGMINEGLCSKGFFNPHFYAVVAFGLEGVGCIFGMNFAWAAIIIVIHTVFTITAPILLINGVFATSERWLTQKMYYLLLSVFGAAVVFAQMRFGRPFIPDSTSTAALLALILLLLLAARFAPDLTLSKFTKRPPVFLLFASGAIYAYCLFFCAISFHRFVPNIILQIGAVIFLLLLLLWFLIKLPEERGRSHVVLVTGLLTPQLIQAFSTGTFMPALLVFILLVTSLVKCAIR